MYLYVYDINTFELEGVITQYNSLLWNRKFNDCGDFEISFIYDIDNLSLMTEGKVLYNRETKEAGIIENVKGVVNSNSEYVVTITGRFIESILSRRITIPTTITGSTHEKIIYKLISDNAINPSNANRKILNLANASEKGIGSNVNNYAIENEESLLERIYTLCVSSDLGFRLNFDYTNKKLVAEVYSSADNTDVIFSENFGSISSQEYHNQTKDFKNTCYVKGKVNDTLLSVVVNNAYTGLNRFETATESVSDVITTDILTSAGYETLSQYKKIISLDSEIDLTSPQFIYGEDWGLGSVVTCINKRFNISLQLVVCEIQESFSSTGKTIDVVFGEHIPTLLDKLKK